MHRRRRPAGTPTPPSSSCTRRTTRRLVRLAVLLVGDVETAEEVVQDSFVAMHGRWRWLREPDKGAGLPAADGGEPVPLGAAAPRRRRARHVAPAVRTEPGADDDAAALGATPRRARRARGSCPTGSARCSRCATTSTCPRREIAETLGISRGAVKSHASRGAAALRTLMEDAVMTDPDRRHPHPARGRRLRRRAAPRPRRDHGPHHVRTAPAPLGLGHRRRRGRDRCGRRGRRRRHRAAGLGSGPSRAGRRRDGRHGHVSVGGARLLRRRHRSRAAAVPGEARRAALALGRQGPRRSAAGRRRRRLRPGLPQRLARGHARRRRPRRWRRHHRGAQRRLAVGAPRGGLGGRGPALLCSSSSTRSGPTSGTTGRCASRSTGRAAATLLGVPTSGDVAAASRDTTLAPVSIDSPADQRSRDLGGLRSPVTVKGSASAFEATVQWELEQGGTVVKRGFATARECCTLSPYTFRFSAPPGDYTLVVHDEDPSGGEGTGTSSDSKQIRVTGGAEG